MGPQLELGRAIPVNSAEKTPTPGLQVSAVGEKYVPPPLKPEDTDIHESIHAALAGEDVEFVTNIPGPGYEGLTRTRKPKALAALGPHAVGGRGTSWDVKVANHIGGASESAARAAVHEQHAEIIEIANDLGEKRVLYGDDVQVAKKRARMKKKYGEFATVSAFTATGERVTARVKVDGDKAAVPKEIVDFSAKVKARQLEEQAQKALEQENNKANPEIAEAPMIVKTPEPSEQLPRGRERLAPISGEVANSKPETRIPENGGKTTEFEKSVLQNDTVQSAEDIIRAELAKIEEEQRLAYVRAELNQLQEAGSQREVALSG